MRIGLDLDGVMYHFHKTAIYMLNTMKGYKLDVADWSYWNWPKDKVSNNDWQWLWSAGVKYGLFRYGHMYKGAIEGVQSLAKLGDIVVITHRPKNAVQDTLDWLSYLKLPFSETHIQSHGQSKAEVKCDMYIDDKPENAIECSPKPTFLFKRTWNENFVWPETPINVVVVEKWSEVLDYAARIRR